MVVLGPSPRPHRLSLSPAHITKSQTHVIQPEGRLPCVFLKQLDSVAVSADERISLLGGYDTRGLSCELQAFAPKQIAGVTPVPFEWRGEKVGANGWVCPRVVVGVPVCGGGLWVVVGGGGVCKLPWPCISSVTTLSASEMLCPACGVVWCVMCGV